MLCCLTGSPIGWTEQSSASAIAKKPVRGQSTYSYTGFFNTNDKIVDQCDHSPVRMFKSESFTIVYLQILSPIQSWNKNTNGPLSIKLTLKCCIEAMYCSAQHAPPDVSPYWWNRQLRKMAIVWCGLCYGKGCQLSRLGHETHAIDTFHALSRHTSIFSRCEKHIYS